MKKILTLILLALLLISCSEEDNPTIWIWNWGYGAPGQTTYVVPGTTNNAGEFAITFGNYQAGNATRAASVQKVGTDWLQLYDEFKLFTWCDTGIVMNPFLVQGTNYNGTSQWAYVGVNQQDTLYFSKYSEWYNFIGVIGEVESVTPLSSHTQSSTIKVNGVESFKATNESGQTNVATPKEFLYSKVNVLKANYANPVNMNFAHGNAKLMFKFTSDRNDTELLDYIPYTPANPGSPAVPGTETYTSKSTKFIDELTSGNEVQVGIGFYGVSSPKLTSTQGNPLYVGSDNTSNGWLAKTWLLSIKDAVNSQFVYYRLNQVNNSTSKTVTTEDWESAASNKNIFMMKLADGVNATDFANGNDAFMNALTAHEADWVGGSPAATFKSTFEQAYAEGWRVIRINVSDANASQVLVFLSNNQNITTQVCEVTGGSPAVPATPEKGLRGFVAVPATSVLGDATDAVNSSFVSKADCELGMSGNTWTQQEYSDSIHFDLPGTTVIGTGTYWSPTVYYTLPWNPGNYGMTVKVSYRYNGKNYYDNRIYIPMASGFEEGKYYIYTLDIRGGNGQEDPDNADDTGLDPVVTSGKGIQITVTVGDYVTGEEKTYIIGQQ